MPLFGSPNVRKLKSVGDVDGLISALADRNRDIREAALAALVELGTTALEPLVAVLHVKKPLVRSGAAVALGRLGDSRAVQSLIELLSDVDPEVRYYAAGALGQIGDARAIQPLIDSFAGSHAHAANRAQEALVEIGTPAIDSLIVALSSESTAIRAAITLAAIGAPAVDALVAALNDASPMVSYGAAKTLGAIGDKRAVGPLTATLQDPDEFLRRLAAQAIESIGASLPEEGIAVEPQPTDPELARISHLIDVTRVTSASLDVAGVEVQKLMLLISLHVDLHPQSSEFFIRKGLALAKSPRLGDRLKAFVLLSQWSRKDSRVDHAIAALAIPKESL